MGSKRQRFVELLEGSSHVAIIGVRVRERDAHIWGPLKKTSAQLLYCSGPTGRDEFLTWQRTFRPNATDEALSGYFDVCFDRVCAHVGIL